MLLSKTIRCAKALVTGTRTAVKDTSVLRKRKTRPVLSITLLLTVICTAALFFLPLYPHGGIKHFAVQGKNPYGDRTALPASRSIGGQSGCIVLAAGGRIVSSPVVDEADKPGGRKSKSGKRPGPRRNPDLRNGPAASPVQPDEPGGTRNPRGKVRTRPD
jgi:hypothetical protein